MESFSSQSEQPAWQDITLTLIAEKINSGSLKDALFLCRLRRDALVEVVEDIQSAKTSATDASEIQFAQWKYEQELIQKEVATLDSYMTEVKNLQSN